MMNAVRLGTRYGVTDDTVRAWARLPGFPPRMRPGRWLVHEFDAAVVKMCAAGGPQMWRWKAFIQSRDKSGDSTAALATAMNAVQLGARYGVTDDTVRAWRGCRRFHGKLLHAAGQWRRRMNGFA